MKNTHKTDVLKGIVYEKYIWAKSIAYIIINTSIQFKIQKKKISNYKTGFFFIPNLKQIDTLSPIFKMEIKPSALPFFPN